MAAVEILAREMLFKIKVNGAFEEIENIDSVTHNPTKTDADTGSFSAAGRARHIVAERGDEFTLTIKYVIDDVTGKEPDGNEALRELATKIGHESIGEFQYVNKMGDGIQFAGSAVVAMPGGGRNDPGTYSVTITVSGDITPVSGGE